MSKINPKTIISNVKSHWKQPPEGKYVSYKEFAAYSVGGIGVNTINALFTYVGLTANCLLIGSAYGIKPLHLATMALIINILNLAKTPFVSMLVDNTDTKYGKFRPYLLYTGVPSAVLLVLMAFVPNTINYWVKCVLLTVIYALLMIFQSLYSLAFNSLAQVLTPNGEERTSIISISQFIYSLGPSIVNIILPIFAGFFPGGMKGFAAYRVLFPIFSIIGVVLGLLAFRGTEEKIIVSKTYVAKVKFFDGIVDVGKNKYFWLMTLYNALSCMKYGIGAILGWYCIYLLKSDATLGVMNALIGTASVPGMLLAPIITKKIGKRATLIAFNALRILFCFAMLFTSAHPVLFIGSLYLATLSIGGDFVVTSSVTADVFDYQQWKTGKRLEGFITQFSGMIVTAFTMATSFILPAFYEHYGLKNDYDVLFQEAVRTPIFNVMIITTIISCIACIIPMIFYDMSAKKQAQIIEELKQRAEAE